VLVLGYNCGIAWHEATRPEVFAVAYLGVAAFVGTYSALDGQSAQPTPWMAVGLLVALLITFGAATSVIFRLSRSGIIRWSTARRKGGIVVVGSSVDADAIARSVDDRFRKSLIRIHEDGAADELGSMVVPNWQRIGDDTFARRIIGAATSVIVAASTDAVSARLAAAVRPLMGGERPFQLIRSSHLARALRPDVLTSLPGAEGFHPADNLGQVIAGVISAHAREFRKHMADDVGRDVPVRVAFEACGDDPMVDSIRAWLVNTATATTFVEEDPSYELVPSDAIAEVCVVAGVAEMVAAEAARRCSDQAVVAAVSADLLGSVSLPEKVNPLGAAEWIANSSPMGCGDLIIVDPERDGLGFRVVLDGLEAQWGRAFNDAYTTLYLAANSEQGAASWTAGRLGRAEQSSIGAALFMLAALREYGFELKLGEAGWTDGSPSPDVVDAMARREHEEWWQRRTWVDEAGVERRVALRHVDGVWRDGRNSVEFDALDSATQVYNREVITRVYPALAAMFGYGIRRAQAASRS